MSEKVGGLKKELKIQLVPFNKLYNCHTVVGRIILNDAEVRSLSNKGSPSTAEQSRGVVVAKVEDKEPGKKDKPTTKVTRQEKAVVSSGSKSGAHWPEMEEHLSKWVYERQQQGETVSRDSIRSHALQWAKEHPKLSVGFSSSEGWCRKFLRRKALILRPGPKNQLACKEEFEKVAEEEEGVETEEGKRKADSDPEEGRSRVTKRTIKKPKMDQFVTFSDCSDLEEEVGRDMTDFEFSDDDSSYRGENDECDDGDSLDGLQASDSQDADDVSWAKLRIPDEVAIQEVNPSLEVYMETTDGKRIKTEPCEQNPFVESTSEFDVDGSNMEVVRYSSGGRIQEVNPLSDSQNDGESGRRFTLDSRGHLTLSLEKKKSPVWRHFKRHPTQPNVAICNHCSVSLKTCKSSTSTLARHVLRHLKERKAITDGGPIPSSEETSEVDMVIYPPEAEASPIQVSSVQSLRSSPPPMPSPPRKKTRDKGVNVSMRHITERPPMNAERFRVITDKVTQMLIKDYQPADVVQNSGFRALMAELEPKYNLPFASYFSEQVIPELHRKTLERKKMESSALVRNSKCCSLTVDQWTSGVGGSVHLAMTCHHMTEDFGISRLFLANSRLSGKQSGQDMHRTIVSTLEDWGFNTSEMQLYVVTESARELQAAASSSKSSWTVLHCFGHSLHLVIRGAMDSMPGYPELARKMRDLSHRYSTVDSARMELKVFLKKQGLNKSPNGDDAPLQGWESCEESAVQGHWVTEYRMIERLVNLKEAIKAELSAKGVGSKLDVDMTEDEWELAEAMVDVLRPLVEALKDFCSATYPPLSMTIPIVYGMEHMLGKVLVEASGAVSSPTPPTPSPSPKRSRTPTPLPPVLPSAIFAKNLLKAVRSRFPSYKTNHTSMVAMVLDPRYKAVILSEQEVNLVTKMLVDEVVEVSLSSSPQPPPEKTSPSKEKSGTKEGEGGDSENKRASSKSSGGLSSLLWSAFEEVSRDQPVGANKKVALYQVKQYLDEPVLSRDCEPLPWWMENRDKYNLILPVARKYASIPATQVKGSMLMGDSEEEDLNVRRMFLPEAQVEHLVFLHENTVRERGCMPELT